MLDNWFFLILVGFVGSLHYLQQLLNPILSPNYFSRNSLENVEVTHILVENESSFHHDSFRETKSWKCVGEDDCYRSCLIELKSFVEQVLCGPQ